MIKATWSKPSATAVTQFTDAAGAPVEADPGPDLGRAGPGRHPRSTRR